MKLADFVFGLMGEAQQMRKGGISLDDIQRGLQVSLVDYARTHGFILSERDMPYSQMHRCAVCRDDGWEPTTRIVRGETLEAYKPCPCKSATRKPATNAAENVARGWK
jgi:hypothetical protein